MTVPTVTPERVAYRTMIEQTYPLEPPRSMAAQWIGWSLLALVLVAPTAGLSLLMLAVPASVGWHRRDRYQRYLADRRAYLDDLAFGE